MGYLSRFPSVLPGIGNSVELRQDEVPGIHLPRTQVNRAPLRRLQEVHALGYWLIAARKQHKSLICVIRPRYWRSIVDSLAVVKPKAGGGVRP